MADIVVGIVVVDIFVGIEIEVVVADTAVKMAGIEGYFGVLLKWPNLCGLCPSKKGWLSLLYRLSKYSLLILCRSVDWS